VTGLLEMFSSKTLLSEHEHDDILDQLERLPGELEMVLELSILHPASENDRSCVLGAHA
jgi:hypothetical protein